MVEDLLLSRFFQVIIRFERELYKNPDQDLNDLWWDLKEEYMLIKRPENWNNADWAYVDNIIIHGTYIQHYYIALLGSYQLRDDMRRKLNINDNLSLPFSDRREGTYLKNIFKLANSKHWNDLFISITGKELSSDCFVKEVDYIVGNRLYL